MWVTLICRPIDEKRIKEMNKNYIYKVIMEKYINKSPILGLNDYQHLQHCM